MVWSNWQGAIWRGAMLVLVCWTGLAWTQTPAPRPAGAPAERIMVVHENGKSVRCRVMESWQLPDGRIAHLLQGVESGEMVTIVDEAPPGADGGARGSRAMPKRIFSWGVGKKTPPEGSPIPPQLRQDSGIVLTNETAPPVGAVQGTAPATMNRVIDDVALGGGTRAVGALPVVPNTAVKPNSVATTSKPANAQVLEFPSNPTAKTPTIIINEQPSTSSRPVLFPRAGSLFTKSGTETIQSPGVIIQTSTDPKVNAPAVQSPAPLPPIGTSNPATVVEKPTPSTGDKPGVDPISPTTSSVVISSKIIEPAPKKSWRPGDVLFGWMTKQPAPSPVKVEPKKADEAKSATKTDSLLSPDTKAGEKQLADRVASLPKAPFSTAMSQTPAAPPTAVVPLPIPGPLANKDEKPSETATPKEDVKPLAVGPRVEKKDMWGLGASDKLVPPGKSLVDPASAKPDVVKLPAAPLAQRVDPLTAPERFIPSSDKLKPKVSVLAPVAMESPMPSAPGNATQPNGWPLGSQSVLAARSGLQGPVAYVPVPIVTQPQPNQPPMPPAPQIPDAPQLNAYVNAFSQPPAPKPAAHPAQASVPQWLQPNANAMAQQQMMQQQMMQQQAMQQQMMQQQAMQQQMVHQQAMMAQGYRPNQPMPPQAPMMNASHPYAGPYGAPSAMQQVSHQQLPTQQAVVTQQVDQLIKVMRESPYPAQREWAAQSLTSFEWRANPQVVTSLMQSASQDPAASVRAGCVTCLGRMGAAVEPVLGTLHSMRNDMDPRVRQEVEQALVRLGQTPTARQ